MSGCDGINSEREDPGEKQSQWNGGQSDGEIVRGKHLHVTCHEILSVAGVTSLYFMCYCCSFTYELYCGLASRYNQGQGNDDKRAGKRWAMHRRFACTVSQPK